MLAITRKAGESVLIRFGEVEVVFRIHKLTAKSARVAIDAPDGVEIVRCELENGKSGKTDNTTRHISSSMSDLPVCVYCLVCVCCPVLVCCIGSPR